jgi:transposase
MDSHTDSRNINRLEIIDTGRRRRWSDEAKLRIVEESFSGPRLASATARRHGISSREHNSAREGRLGESIGFVPAVIAREPAEKGTGPDCSRIEIVSANGRRVIVDYDVDVERLLGIIRGLEKLS